MRSSSAKFLSILTYVTLISCGGGGGGGKVTVIGNQGPRTDYLGVAIADFNADGSNDLVASSLFIEPNGSFPTSLNLFIQYFNDPGLFALSSNLVYASSVEPFQVTARDFQGDFLPDVLSSGTGESGFRLMLQSTTEPGVLQVPQYFSGPQGWVKHSVADIDLDGLLDVALVGDNQVTYRLQDASNPGQFLEQQLVGSGRESLAVGDVNGDGLPDIVTFNPGAVQDRILYYRHDPAMIGLFLPPQSIDIRMGGQSLAIADMNGDFKADIVFSGLKIDDGPDFHGYWGYMEQSSTNMFSYHRFRTSADLLWHDFAVADLNSDGRNDMVVASRNIHIFLQATAGNFPIETAIRPPVDQAISVGPISSIDVADLNADGLPDIAFTNGELFVLFQQSSGNGIFRAPTRIAGQN